MLQKTVLRPSFSAISLSLVKVQSLDYHVHVHVYARGAYTQETRAAISFIPPLCTFLLAYCIYW